jgi:hypothetical protein
MGRIRGDSTTECEGSLEQKQSYDSELETEAEMKIELETEIDDIEAEMKIDLLHSLTVEMTVMLALESSYHCFEALWLVVMKSQETLKH